MRAAFGLGELGRSCILLISLLHVMLLRLLLLEYIDVTHYNLVEGQLGAISAILPTYH